MAEANPALPLQQALINATRFLDDLSIPYALVGGLAVAVWGEPRATFDVDIVLATTSTDVDRLIEAVRASSDFALPPETLRFTRLVAVRAHVVDRSTHEPDLILIDFLFLEPHFAATVIGRRIPIAIGDHTIWVCSAEDLVLLKLLAARVKDLEDIRGVLKSRRDRLDLSYVTEWTGKLALTEKWRELQS